MRRLTADNPAHRRIMTQTLGVGTEINIIIADTVQTRLLAQERSRREAMREMTARAAAFLKLVEEQANTRSSPTIAQAVSEPGKWPSRSS